VNGHDCLIIGVMPARFDFPMRLATTVSTPSGHMDFWAPEAIDPTRTHREATGYGAIARLRPGTSLSQAQQDLAVIAARLAHAYPRTNEDRTLHAGWLRDRTLGFAQTGLLLLMAAALIFLMIGCANVANLASPPVWCPPGERGRWNPPVRSVYRGFAELSVRPAIESVRSYCSPRSL
jgi:hypothetical protein